MPGTELGPGALVPGSELGRGALVLGSELGMTVRTNSPSSVSSTSESEKIC